MEELSFYVFMPRGYKLDEIWSLARTPCGSGFEYLHRSPAIRRRRQKEPSAWGCNWATPFLGDINTGTWPSGWGESRI
jgi:hypothetical protein